MSTVCKLSDRSSSGVSSSDSSLRADHQGDEVMSSCHAVGDDEVRAERRPGRRRPTVDELFCVTQNCSTSDDSPETSQRRPATTFSPTPRTQCRCDAAADSAARKQVQPFKNDSLLSGYVTEVFRNASKDKHPVYSNSLLANCIY